MRLFSSDSCDQGYYMYVLSVFPFLCMNALSRLEGNSSHITPMSTWVQ